MNTTTISRREELCRSLNMNFDEASELFCNETLFLPGTSIQVDSIKVGADGRPYYWMSGKPGSTTAPNPTPTPPYNGAGASF